ncbi:MAG: DUF5658 family protein [Acidimicrobiia bacterium]
MTTLARRGGDRRTARVAFRFPERRTGFDRRAYAGVVTRYRDRPGLIAAALTGIVLLNLADFALTLRALDLGAREANPVMAGLLELSPGLAGTVKIVVAVGVSAVIWQLRRYRRILEVSLLALAGFTMLVTYQITMLLSAA